jgi:hypothetical protein
MHKDSGKFLTLFRRGLACLWALVGLYLFYLSLSHFQPFDFWAIIKLAVATTFVAGAFGFFLDRRWGRICIGCLMVLVVLFGADMLLFIAFRGLDASRTTLLGLVVALMAASVCTWTVLSATRRVTDSRLG